MVRRLNLLITAALAGALTMSSSFVAHAETCEQWQQKIGLCTSGSSDGTGVNIDASKRGGSGGSQGSDGPGSSSGSGHVLTKAEIQALLDEICVSNGHCGAPRGAAELNPLIEEQQGGTATPADPARVITIADLARFLPAAGALHMEPNGWAVVGVPANFWADASAITVPGSLLGETAQVRFSPLVYRFAYGDGSSRSTETPGASWASLGQQELTATSTSHVYSVRGAEAATVTVVYSAEYRFADGPWIAVSGAVSATAPPQRVLVVVERTALTTPA